MPPGVVPAEAATPVPAMILLNRTWRPGLATARIPTEDSPGLTPFAAMTANYVRNSLTDVLAQGYIRTARAYGINPGKLLFKYAMKNALLPLVTLLGLHLPFLISGAVVTEYIFAWPGMGSLTVNAIFAHDYPVILASSFLAAVAVVLGNQLSDFLYTLADPRISIKSSA